MLYFVKKPEGYQVTVVAPNGPADQAGIKLKDVIVEINGVDAAGLSTADLLAQMNRPSYTMTVQRPGGTETVTVHAELYAELVKQLHH